MTRDEALELIERMAFIPTIKAPSKKILADTYRASAESDDPVEWVRVVKSCYARMHFGGPGLGEEETACGGSAKKNLEAELGNALGLRPDAVEAYITKYVAENI